MGEMIKYLRGAAGIGLNTTIKYRRRSTSEAMGNGLGNTAKYLRCKKNGIAGNGRIYIALRRTLPLRR
jgi:hypothetical protein